MPTIHWTLTINHQPHSVRLEHGSFSGKRDIYVDEKLVEHSQKLIDSGSGHCLTIDGQAVHLFITSNGITFDYHLLNSLEPIPSDRDLRAGRSAEALLKTKPFADILVWREIKQRLKLPYIVDARLPWILRHRMIGMYGGYLVRIKRSVLVKPARDGITILVRYAPLTSPDQIERIAKDERIPPLLGNLRNDLKLVLDIQEKSALIFLPIKAKETPASIADRIQQFITIVSGTARRLEQGRCEDANCQSHGAAPARLVLINDVPYLLCQPCIDYLPEIFKQDKEMLRQAPDNLLPGVIVGFGAAILMAVVLAGLALLLPAYAGVFFLAPVLVVVLLMKKLKVKSSWKMLLMSAGLSILTVILGFLLLIFLTMIRVGYPVSLDTLIKAGQDMLQDARLKTALVMTGMFIAINLFSWWMDIRSSQRAMFDPHIEILSAGPSAQGALK